jgi:hypothetical protein
MRIALFALLALLFVPVLHADPAKEGGRIAPDHKTEIQIDLPGPYHRHNVSSRGQGCCVQTSIGHSARWQNVTALIDMQKWVQEKGIPGGANPSSVDQRIPRCCKDRGFPVAEYLQVQGKDLEVLKLALKSGRFPAVTYSKSPTGRYSGRRIAHMVSMPHGDDQYVAILDNNYPGVDRYEWMTWDEYMRICNLGGGYWAVILLDPGPPPLPWN